MTGVPVAKASTTERPNGSAKLMRCSSARAPPSSASRSLGTDRAHVGHVDAVDVRGHGVAEVRLVLDDPGDDERHARTPGDLDREVRALVRMDPAEEQQVVAGLRDEGEPGEVDAVMDRRGVVQVRVPVASLIAT